MPSFVSLDALLQSAGEGWSRGHDTYGTVTYVRVKAAVARNIALALEGGALHPMPSP
jgi:alpha-glucosidase